MEDVEIIKTIDTKNEALAAMKQIVGRDHIVVMVSNIGSHLAMWASWKGPNGLLISRQFSWSIEHPGHDGRRLQWIYNAFWKYGLLQRKLQNGTWGEEGITEKDYILIHD